MITIKKYLKEEKNYTGAIEYLIRNFSKNFEEYPNQYDSVLGYKINFITEKAFIQTWIEENKNEILLTSIGSKELNDLSKTIKGTGEGTRLIYLLKDYSDKTGKKFIIPDATEPAVPYYKKIPFLKRDDEVYIYIDDKLYIPKHNFSYTPK